LKEQTSRLEETIKTLENEKEAIQNKYEELKALNADLLSEKEQASETIKELQEKR
jgi:chaperonin cofactor prefoldin